MPVGVNIPKRKQDDGGLGDLMSIGNIAMGAMTGNPLQAAQGASGLAKEEERQPIDPIQTSGGAVQRRLAKQRGY